MGGGNHHSALSRAGGKTENMHCSRKAHSFLKSEIISRFIQCSFHSRHSSRHLPSESALLVKVSEGVSARTRCYMEFRHAHTKIQDFTPGNTVHYTASVGFRPSLSTMNEKEKGRSEENLRVPVTKQ